MRHPLLPALLLALACGSRLPAADQPIPPKEAAGKMKLPPGFKVQLFAGEPDVVQPIAFTFDDRGRMWVVECLMYPKWSQDGKGGKDRVVILEDTDGDGTFDKKTVVIDDGVNLSGIELGFGGVYLCSSPNLLFVPIKDDKPAGKPEVLLDGWNIKDAKHNVFNSLIWGPDGWLYGCNGIQTKSKVGKPGAADKDRVFFDCGVWRFHTTRKVFEVVANGTTNPFGLDFDEHGEMFITNCVIDHLFHVVPGGHYTRMYGNDPNPYVYGAMGSAVDYKHWGGGAWTDSRANKDGSLKKEHDDAGGGHAHAGCAIYQGDNFPKEYRNTLFTCNIHGNRLNNDGLERTASGMKGVRRPDFLFANDPWFRGICVKQGPAGELFVSDWSDTGECHNYDKVDASNGRIYRVTYGDLKPFKGDVSKMTDAELVKAVTSTNEWLSRHARRVLQERAVGRGLDSREAQTTTEILLKELLNATSTVKKLRLLWALNAVNDARVKPGMPDIEKQDIAVQSWTTRIIGDVISLSGGSVSHEVREHVFLILSVPDIVPLRRMIANQLRRYAVETKHATDVKPEDRGKLIDWVAGSLFTHDSDPDTTLMCWYAVDACEFDVRRLIKTKAKQPILYEYLIRKRMSVGDAKREMDAALEEMSALPSDECRIALLRGLTDALRGSQGVKATDMWQAVYAKYSTAKSLPLRSQLDDVGLLLDDPVARKAILARAVDASADAAERSRSVSLLASRRTADFAPKLLDLLAETAVRAAAIRGLGHYADDATPKTLLALYPKLTSEEKADAVQTLSVRASYALALLDAVEAGTVPKADVTAFTARQIATLKDKAVAARLAKVWGEVKPASANRQALMDKYKAILTADALAAADPTKGKAIFTKSCATCHKLFGEGQSVGPELTGAQRGNLDYILENVVDPSAVVPTEYKMTQFFLKDGRAVSGLVKKDTPQAVTVRTLNEEVVIAVKDVDERKGTNNSLMPEGLLDVLKPEEVRDLVRYLMSKEPVK